MNCDESIRLIAAAMEGRVPPPALEMLLDHLEECPVCRFEADMQMTVRRLIESRVEEPLPEGMAERLTARLSKEGPIVRRSVIDWLERLRGADHLR